MPHVVLRARLIHFAATADDEEDGKTLSPRRGSSSYVRKGLSFRGRVEAKLFRGGGSFPMPSEGGFTK